MNFPEMAHKYLGQTVAVLSQMRLWHNSGYYFELVVQLVVMPYNGFHLKSETLENCGDQGVL